MQQHNIEGSRREFAELNGPSLREVVQILRDRHNLGPSAQDLLETYMGLIDNAYADILVEMPGASRLLQWLQHRKIRTLLVTSSPASLVEPFLSKQRWSTYFERIVTGEQVDRAKPDPEIYLKACDGMLNKRSIIVIEDSPNGIRAAHSAGLRVIGVTPHNQADLKAAGAAAAFSTLDDVIEWLEMTGLTELNG